MQRDIDGKWVVNFWRGFRVFSLTALRLGIKLYSYSNVNLLLNQCMHRLKDYVSLAIGHLCF